MRYSIIAAAAASLAAATAKATLVLTLSQGASTVTVVDNGAGDLSPTPGVIISTLTVGNFSTSFTVGTSNSPGSSSQGLLQIQTLTVRNNAAVTSTLSMALSDTGFTLPGGPGSVLALSSSIGGTLVGSSAVTDGVTFQSYGDPANGNPFASAFTPGPQVYVSTGLQQVSFNSTVTSLLPFTGPAYSLGNLTSITLSALAQGNISGTTSTTVVVPEPAMAGLAIGAVALVARRRRS